eukprot:6457181-Amphidinium_carterae.3
MLEASGDDMLDIDTMRERSTALENALVQRLESIGQPEKVPEFVEGVKTKKELNKCACNQGAG